MDRFFHDLAWVFLTLAVVGVVWSAAQDLYYGGGPLLSMGVGELPAILIYLVILVFLYAVVTLANS